MVATTMRVGFFFVPSNMQGRKIFRPKGRTEIVENLVISCLSVGAKNISPRL